MSREAHLSAHLCVWLFAWFVWRACVAVRVSIAAPCTSPAGYPSAWNKSESPARVTLRPTSITPLGQGVQLGSGMLHPSFLVTLEPSADADIIVYISPNIVDVPGNIDAMLPIPYSPATGNAPGGWE